MIIVSAECHLTGRDSLWSRQWDNYGLYLWSCVDEEYLEPVMRRFIRLTEIG